MSLYRRICVLGIVLAFGLQLVSCECFIFEAGWGEGTRWKDVERDGGEKEAANDEL